MSIKVALEHYTRYEFAKPVSVTPHVVRLRPAPHSRTPIEAYSLEVSPKKHFINWQQDPFGNWLARIVFPDPISHLEITVGLVADMMVQNPLDFFIEEYAERFPFAYEPSLARDLAPYLRPADDASAANAWRLALPRLGGIDDLPGDGIPTVAFLAQLNQAVHDAVGYTVRMEAGVQTPDGTLERASGSCRDSAWLLVALLRQYGLAARFVSGYLVQLTRDQESLDGPSGPEADFTDLHAWAEVYVPGAGWIGLDATSALFAGEGHIPLSAAPHPSSAAPRSLLTILPLLTTSDSRSWKRSIRTSPNRPAGCFPSPPRGPGRVRRGGSGAAAPREDPRDRARVLRHAQRAVHRDVPATLLRDRDRVPQHRGARRARPVRVPNGRPVPAGLIAAHGAVALW